MPFLMLLMTHRMPLMTHTEIVLWIRNCSAYSEPMTSHMLDGLAGSWQMLLHMYPAVGDVMAAILKVWCQMENLTLSINLYLLEEHSCQISSRSDLKWQSRELLLKRVASTRTRRTTRWVVIWDQFLIQNVSRTRACQCEQKRESRTQTAAYEDKYAIESINMCVHVITITFWRFVN